MRQKLCLQDGHADGHAHVCAEGRVDRRADSCADERADELNTRMCSGYLNESKQVGKKENELNYFQ